MAEREGQAMVFLAAEVLAVGESTEVPLGPDTVARINPRTYFSITLRVFDGKKVQVIDFEASTGVPPRAIRWAAEEPTTDDLRFLQDMELHDLRPVDVKGEAYREDQA